MNSTEGLGFQLNVTLTRVEVVEWLGTIPANQLTEVVENTLAAGHLVMSLLQASAGEESMRRFFRPVVERMDELKGTLEGFLRATQKSQRIGELGEDIVCSQLKSAFPADSFEIASKEGHQADIHAWFTVTDRDSPKALIEVKLYTGDVPRQEVDKFRDDLKETGVRYGLMVSLTSRITGMSGPMQLEVLPSNFAIFVPNAGLDGHALVCGASLLKAIAAYEARAGAGRNIPTAAIEQAWARLNEEMKELESAASEVHGLRDGLRTAQESIQHLFGHLIETAVGVDLRLRHSLDRLGCRLSEELAALPHTPGSPPAIQPATPDAVLAFIAELMERGDRRAQSFSDLYHLLDRLGISIVPDGGHWQLLRNGQPLGRTAGTKTRLDIALAIDDEQPIKFRRKSEKIVGDELVIDGANIKLMLAGVEEKLTKA